MSNIKVLSKKQVSDILGISQVTIWRWVRDGILPKPLQLGPRRIAWRESDISEYLEKLGG